MTHIDITVPEIRNDSIPIEIKKKKNHVCYIGCLELGT